MITDLCLWSGTLAGHDLWTRIRAAGQAGFASLSVAPYELDEVVAAGASGRLAAELTTHSVRLSCLDPIATWLPDPVPAHPAHAVHASIEVARCLDLAQQFGIGLVNAIDVTWGRLPDAAADGLADLAARASRCGITVVVEAQTYSAIPDLATALELCRAAGSNVRPLLDAWHFFRAATAQPADLDGVPIGAVQLSDGPAHAAGDLVAESVTGRLKPGRGDFDLAALIAAIPPGCVVGPEVFTSPVAVDRVDDVTRTALTATREVLAGAP